MVSVKRSTIFELNVVGTDQLGSEAVIQNVGFDACPSQEMLHHFVKSQTADHRLWVLYPIELRFELLPIGNCI